MRRGHPIRQRNYGKIRFFCCNVQFFSPPRGSRAGSIPQRPLGPPNRGWFNETAAYVNTLRSSPVDHTNPKRKRGFRLMRSRFGKMCRGCHSQLNQAQCSKFSPHFAPSDAPQKPPSEAASFTTALRRPRPFVTFATFCSTPSRSPSAPANLPSSVLHLGSFRNPCHVVKLQFVLEIHRGPIPHNALRSNLPRAGLASFSREATSFTTALRPPPTLRYLRDLLFNSLLFTFRSGQPSVLRPPSSAWVRFEILATLSSPSRFRSSSRTDSP